MNVAAFVAANSVHVPEQLSSVLYTLVAPAQAPQMSMLAIMLWFVKCELILQSVDGNSASAVPQLDGSGVVLLELMSWEKTKCSDAGIPKRHCVNLIP